VGDGAIFAFHSPSKIVPREPGVVKAVVSC